MTKIPKWYVITFLIFLGRRGLTKCFQNDTKKLSKCYHMEITAMAICSVAFYQILRKGTWIQERIAAGDIVYVRKGDIAIFKIVPAEEKIASAIKPEPKIKEPKLKEPIAPRAPAKPKPLSDIPTRFRVDPDNPKLPTYEWYRSLCLLKTPNASDDQIQRGYEEVYKDVLPKQPDKQPEPPPFKPHELPSYNDYRENAMGVWGAEFSEDECEESYRRKGGIPKLD